MRFTALSVLVLGLVFVSVQGQLYSVTRDGKHSFTLVSGKAADYVAVAQVNTNPNATGWANIDVVTNGSADDFTQAFAAGYIEGALMTDLIYDSWMTTLEYFYGGTFSPLVAAWLEKNNDYLRTQTLACNGLTRGTPKYEAADCDYWYQITLVLLQMEGMAEGYNDHCDAAKRLTPDIFLYININADIGDILAKVDPSSRPKTPLQFLEKDHCSVLVKYSLQEQQLYHSHTTWGHYANMLRVFKHYTLNYNHPSTVSKKVSFSGFPGFLASGDDYFVTDTGLIVTETTNDVFNMSLYDYVQPDTVLYWLRVVVTNRMVSNGSAWVNTFAKYNSGTYNNQWQVTDTKLFTPGKPIQPNTLWIVEQIPGFCVSEDVSSFLADGGHWPSYNVPYFPFIYNISGYPAKYEQYGDAYSYSACPRANIFRRDQSKVVTFEDMQNIMRYNEYQTDPLSLGNACNSISARCDLNTTVTAYPWGGYDCKVSSTALIKNMTTTALSGPTTLTQAPFAWTGPFASTPHYGQPTTFDFDFETMYPQQL